MRIKNKAFTLIELLVTISIIGILATLLVANFNSTRQRARDAQRKSDLRNIQTALRLYYNDCGEYPTGSGGGLLNGCGTCDTPTDCEWDGEKPFSTDRQTYMNVIPQDPQYEVGVTFYNYTNIDSDNYTLSACLENGSDDRCSNEVCGSDNKGCFYSVHP